MTMTEQTARKLTGYCTRCGGDCFDDGKHNYHRCPPTRPEAPAIVALKYAVDDLQRVIDRRPWASLIRKEDCADLMVALKQMRDTLSRVYGDGERLDGGRDG